MLLKQTKIVASISDRRCDVDFIKHSVYYLYKCLLFIQVSINKHSVYY